MLVSDLLIGLLAIAVSIIGVGVTIRSELSGLRRELGSFRSEANRMLSSIETTVERGVNTLERLNEFVRQKSGEPSSTRGLSMDIPEFPSTGAVEVECKNIGKVKVSAEPFEDETVYAIDVQKPILKTGFIVVKTKEKEFAGYETELFGRETRFRLISPNRVFWYVPSTDPKLCTKFIKYLISWLDTTYFNSLEEFEKGIVENEG